MVAYGTDLDYRPNEVVWKLEPGNHAKLVYLLTVLEYDKIT